MATPLKLKIKKCGMVRKIDNEKVSGFYGRVITNGTLSFSEVAKQSANNTTLPRQRQNSPPTCCSMPSQSASSRATSSTSARSANSIRLSPANGMPTPTTSCCPTCSPASATAQATR